MFIFMSSVLKDLFNNTKMQYKLGIRDHEGVRRFREYSYSWEENLIFRKDNIEFYYNNSLNLLFEEFTLKIYVENILVYKDGWVHNVPKEMKKHIKSIVKEIDNYNKQCDKSSLYKDYKKFLKAEKLEEKQRKIRQHENEKNRLIEIFKGK